MYSTKNQRIKTKIAIEIGITIMKRRLKVDIISFCYPVHKIKQ